MTLGQRIFEHRKRLGLSQGELAEKLEVSRQSVSKWETDGAVPEIDKLIKLADSFGITIDELIKGDAPDARASAEDENVNIDMADAIRQNVEKRFLEAQSFSFAGNTSSFEAEKATSSSDVSHKRHDSSLARHISGTVLLCAGALVLLFLAIGGGGWLSLLFAMPFFLCGIICFAFKKHIGLWCAWAVYFSFDLYMMLATGISRGAVWLTLRWTYEMNYMRLAFAWLLMGLLILLVVTTAIIIRKSISKGWSVVKAIDIGVCIAVMIIDFSASRHISKLLFETTVYSYNRSLMRLYTLASFSLDWVNIICIAIIFTIFLSFFGQRKNDACDYPR